MTSMEVLGWVGSITMSLSSLPQLWKVVREQHATGVSAAFLALWLCGTILTLIYVAPTHNWCLIANYSINICVILGIGYYKLKHTTPDCINFRDHNKPEIK